MVVQIVKGITVDILVLEDDLSRVSEFEKKTGIKVRHVASVTDFINCFHNQIPEVVFLDHDLGDDLKLGTGADAARWLAHNKIGTGDYQIQVIIWSLNPIGVANMMSHLKHADHIATHVIPFAWHKASVLNNQLNFSI